MNDFVGLELRSRIGSDGTLALSLEKTFIGPPTADELIVRVEAAPINPSDLGLLLGPADLSTVAVVGGDAQPMVQFSIPTARLAAQRTRIDRSLAVGNEGAGTVVAAGSAVEHLLHRKVGMRGGGMYTQFRKVSVADVIELPDGASAADGAAMFVNPLTALAFVETAKMEQHAAIVHTAAASNLGQMLQRLCAHDGIPLVNVVRSDQQVALLQAQGAAYALNSAGADFRGRLTDAIFETGATVAFDAIGGGSVGSDIVHAMEKAANRNATEFSRYGSDTFKQLYIYGSLDPSPTIFNRSAFGFGWSVSGFLLTPFLRKLSPDAVAALRQRVSDELLTTFASRYTATISLRDALKPDVIMAYQRKATGQKFLIDPTL